MTIPRLSLLVPIYGVEKYINRFLASLLPNLQSDIEIIMIDDGSPDNCGAIIDDFQKNQPYPIRVTHTKNNGVSAARNIGLSIATGEYIAFADPDDYLSQNLIKEVLLFIKDYNYPDFIFYDYYTCRGKKVRIQTVPTFSEGRISKLNFLEEFAKDEAIRSMLWKTVIKKDMFKGLKFDPSLKVGEDASLLTDVVLHVNTIVYLKKPLYYWVEHKDSLSQNATLSDDIKIFLIFEDRYKKFKNLLPSMTICIIIRHIYNVVRRAEMDGYVDSNVIRCKKIINDNIKLILCDKNITFRTKKHCLFSYLGISKYYNLLKTKI
jgi:Glycosyltransferases involved in cell wall biogenesis